MKWFLLCGLLLLSELILADAGFSIRRRKARAHISFFGTENLNNHKLIHVSGYYTDTADKRPYANKGQIVDDAYAFTVQNGGRRWEESDRLQKFMLVDMQTGITTDSFTLFVKDQNIQFLITGEKDGHLQYSTKKDRAVYQYTLAGEEVDAGTHKTNMVIYIFTSLLGLGLLIYLFIRQKRKLTV